MIKRLYYLFRRLITARAERGAYSGGLWPRLVREAAAAAVQEASGRMIELGCGEGLFLELLSRRNPKAELWGIDNYDAILEAARERLAGAAVPVTLRNMNALKNPLPPSHYDHCFCVNTVINLRSLDETRALFREAHRLLKPGGRFLFDIRNALNPVIVLQYRFARIYDPDISVPLSAFHRRQITRLIEDVGLRLEWWRGIGFPRGGLAPAILFSCAKDRP